MDRDVAAGRFEAPVTPRHTAVSTHCATCWGQRAILEPSPLGLVPVVCEACEGTGRRRPR